MTSILILALLIAQQAAPPEKCTLSGTVVDSLTGMPLAKVELVAEKVGGSDPGASTITDAKGTFAMVELNPGQYRLLARRNGYLDTYYGARRSSDSGSTITLTPSQTLDDLQVKLAPTGVIAGTIRDSDGEPMVGVHVWAYFLRYRNGQKSIDAYDPSQADDLGQYRITNLPPGKYFISVDAHDEAVTSVDHSVKSKDPPEMPITTFYPGTSDPSAAKPIQLSAGSRVTGADIAMVRSRLYKIDLHIDIPAGLQGNTRLVYSGETLKAGNTVGKSRRLNTSGDVEITGVPPGSYRLQVGASEPSKPVYGVIDLGGQKGCWTSVPISVEHADLEGIRVVASNCAEVIGNVRDEAGKVPALSGSGFGESVKFMPSAGSDAFLKADGSFRQSLSPGHYNIDLSDITDQGSTYVKSIRIGNQDVLRDGFTVSGSEKIEMDIVLASDGGRIEGVASDTDGKPFVGATVVLIPDDPAFRARPDFTRDATADSTGHFELKGAAPGQYKLFAWDDIEKESWFDPDVLKDFESKGVPVVVKATDKSDKNKKDGDSQTVTLQVIQ